MYVKMARLYFKAFSIFLRIEDTNNTLNKKMTKIYMTANQLRFGVLLIMFDCLKLITVN